MLHWFWLLLSQFFYRFCSFTSFSLNTRRIYNACSYLFEQNNWVNLNNEQIYSRLVWLSNTIFCYRSTAKQIEVHFRLGLLLAELKTLLFKMQISVLKSSHLYMKKPHLVSNSQSWGRTKLQVPNWKLFDCQFHI